MTRSRADFEQTHRLKLVVSYDGKEFSGSQRQPGKRTVQGALEAAASSLFGVETAISLAGRTDSGVHAIGQVASCLDLRPDLSDWQLSQALRSRLPEDLAIGSVERVPPDFDPRRDAKWRLYRYFVWNGPPNPLVRDRAARIERALDIRTMSRAAQVLVGEQDFATFAGLGKGVPWSEREGRGTVRRIWSIQVRTTPELLGPMVSIDVVGDAFLPGQVRSMVGALIEIGLGRKTPEWLAGIVARRDRRAGPKSAPAHGLVLWHIGFEPYTGVTGSTGPSGVEREQG